MTLSDVGKAIANMAPLLGGAMGPFGTAIGSIIAAKFGGSIDDPDDLLRKIQADPQASVKLLEIQSNNEVELQRIYMQMAENELKYRALEKENEYKDRASARERETALAVAGKPDSTNKILAYMAVVGIVFLTYYLFTNEIPEKNKQIVDILIGAFIGFLYGVKEYYFGDSQGSRAKDNMIAIMTPPSSLSFPSKSATGSVWIDPDKQ